MTPVILRFSLINVICTWLNGKDKETTQYAFPWAFIPESQDNHSFMAGLLTYPGYR
ncbi:MAG: hypothetical protein Kow00127_03880 [Bacteroidales bacterium]